MQAEGADSGPRPFALPPVAFAAAGQLLGGALILAGIAFVRSEKRVDAPLEAVPIPEPSHSG